MDKPKITPWNESNIDKPENFKCYRPFRLNRKDGQPTKSYTKGETVENLIGSIKKDLYFQNKIMFEKDFNAVVEYEKGVKADKVYTPEVSKESSEASIQKAAVKAGKAG
jgi:hypothetical protein